MGLKTSKNFKTALKTADTWFSRYIRLRDSNRSGMCACITCEVRRHYKDMDAGHFLSRQYMATRFDERNVHAQCPRCNQYGSGEQYLHSLSIERKYPKGTIEDLLVKSKTLQKYNKILLMELARSYKEKYINECKDKGIQIEYR